MYLGDVSRVLHGPREGNSLGPLTWERAAASEAEQKIAPKRAGITGGEASSSDSHSPKKVNGVEVGCLELNWIWLPNGKGFDVAEIKHFVVIHMCKPGVPSA